MAFPSTTIDSINYFPCRHANGGMEMKPLLATQPSIAESTRLGGIDENKTELPRSFDSMRKKPRGKQTSFDANNDNDIIVNNSDTSTRGRTHSRGSSVVSIETHTAYKQPGVPDY
jgi:hypothetical protein